MRNTKRLLIGGLAILTCVASSVAIDAVASASAKSQTYYGCADYHTGAFSIRDASGKCASGYSAISWNQAGPKGKTGPRGKKGSQGKTGPAGPGESAYNNATVGTDSFETQLGTSYVTAAKVTVPAGSYVFDSSLSVQGTAGDEINCVLTPPGAPEGYQQVTDFISAGGQANMSLTAAETVSSSTSIELQCQSSAATGDHTFNADLVAIEVNKLTDQTLS